MLAPYLVRFTDHAAWRAGRRGIGLAAVEATVVDLHDRRRKNPGGAAEWRVEGGGIVVLYDWPTGDDHGVAPRAKRLAEVVSSLCP